MKKVLTVLAVLVAGVLALSMTLVDDLGRSVEFTKDVKRVVVAAPSVSDFIVTLGLQSKVVGVTDWDKNIKAEKIGNMTPLNIEKILSLKPDVVFVTGGFQEGEVARLEKAKIRTFVINPESFEDIFRNLVQIGNIFGKRAEAEKISTEYRNKIRNIAKEAAKWQNKPSVFFANYYGNLSNIYTAGTGSYMNEVISKAGGLNVAAPYTGNNGWFPVGPEFIVKYDPDIIIVPAVNGDVSSKDAFLKAPQLKNVSAVKTGKVFLVDQDLSSQASPRLIKFFEQLNKILGENK